jgi:hypothetical protein
LLPASISLAATDHAATRILSRLHSPPLLYEKLFLANSSLLI